MQGSSLTHLNISHNLQTDTFLTSLYSSPSTRLTHLNISRNYLSPSTLLSILSSPQTIHLRSLHLDCSPQCARLLLTHLKESLHFKNLQYLSLQWCDLGNEEILLLGEARCLSGLRGLELGGNRKVDLGLLGQREDVECEGWLGKIVGLVGQ